MRFDASQSAAVPRDVVGGRLAVMEPRALL